ncbi:MAG TPA: CGNR zinc finger domain-containing protein [Micromonosporaceae bacterium]|jgi:predicted RNA-binding Zn ribbon-like protein
MTGEPLAIELMNTVRADRSGVHDTLTRPDGWHRWLPATASPDAVERLRDLRDAVRRLAADVTGDDRTAAASPIADVDRAVAVLNDAAALAPSWSELMWPASGEAYRIRRFHHDEAEAALATLAEAAVALFAGPDRALLRACHAPGCVLYFRRDHPRREWCSAGCGNRARVARHYQRHHAASN